MENVVSPFNYDANIILDLCKFVLLQLQFFFLDQAAVASIFLDQECFILQKSCGCEYICIFYF